MSKRDGVTVKVNKDYWPTIDKDCINEGIANFLRNRPYAEVCYGEGHLEELIGDLAPCKWRSDIRETLPCSVVMDALDISKDHLRGVDQIVTNPPYSWELLQPLLEYLPGLKPTWFLLKADLMHNVRMVPYMRDCAWVVSVGRLCWVPKGGKFVKGVDNFAWYRFNKGWGNSTRFVGRTDRV